LVFLVERTLNALGGVALIRSESLVTNEQPALVSAKFRATIAAEIEADVVAAGSDVVVKAVEVVTAVEMAAPTAEMEIFRRCNFGSARAINAEDLKLFSEKSCEVVGRQFVHGHVSTQDSDSGVFYEIISAAMDKEWGLLYNVHFEIYCEAIEVGVKEMEGVLEDSTALDDARSS
jgi:hypothetical protein